MAALEIGIPAFVRVPANTPEYISRVLDGGAVGVIAPHVRSAAQAREVVRHARFAPRGDRSANGGLPHLQYRSFPAAEANLARAYPLRLGTKETSQQIAPYFVEYIRQLLDDKFGKASNVA